MHKPIKFKRNLILKRIIFIIIILATFYIIFNFSSQDGEQSSSLSKKITTTIVEILSKIKSMNSNDKAHYIAKLNPIIRKLAHFSIYAVVGFSVMGFMCTFDMRNILKVILSLSIGVIFAVSDEFHQSFTPGRSPRLFDIGIDTLGVLMGIFIMIVLILFIGSIIDWLKK